MSKIDQLKPTLVFVYNADSGVFNLLTDIAHKAFSPQTYSCNLCALTHSTFGMRKEWKQFLETLNCDFEFLHADELKEQYKILSVPLPAIFMKNGEELKLWLGADSVNSCQTLDELKSLITNKLTATNPTN